MFDELVKKIRHCATDPMHCLSCVEVKDGRCFNRLMTQAADAIEELLRENKEIVFRANQLEAMNDALSKDDDKIETEPFEYDEEEIHPNCTVQIWRNSKTGGSSIGWWENGED